MISEVANHLYLLNLSAIFNNFQSIRRYIVRGASDFVVGEELLHHLVHLKEFVMMLFVLEL